MVKTGRIEAGYSPDETTGAVADRIEGGRAVAGTTKKSSLRDLPRGISLKEKQDGHVLAGDGDVG